jgi:4-hydroxy-4-methyl-2-oxoglutarate aldolase
MDSNLRSDAIEYLKKNRLSTTEFADALGKVGHINGPKPLRKGLHVSGRVRHVISPQANNSIVHRLIPELEKGDILLVDVIGPIENEIAIMGELMVKSAILYQQASAVVVRGHIRDAARITRENFPVWSIGVSPIGAANTPELPIVFGPLDQGIAVCDDGGVVVIPESYISTDLLERLQLIEMQEDVWNFCINTLKWTTFDTVVRKRYFEEPGLLPQHFAKWLERLKNGFTPMWLD